MRCHHHPRSKPGSVERWISRVRPPWQSVRPPQTESREEVQLPKSIQLPPQSSVRWPRPRQPRPLLPRVHLHQGGPRAEQSVQVCHVQQSKTLCSQSARGSTSQIQHQRQLRQVGEATDGDTNAKEEIHNIECLNNSHENYSSLNTNQICVSCYTTFKYYEY